MEVEVNRHSTWSSDTARYRLNVHEDILGSSIYYTRPASGYTANKHSYDVWGYNSKAPTYNYDPEYRATEPYYTGHPYDGSLNLYYAENRFYDAQTGAFLSRDPACDGLNWYSYCGNNPTSYVDPLGLKFTNPNLMDEDIPQNNNFWYHEEPDGKPGRVEDIPKPDNFPALDDLYESSDLTSGRLQLSGCGYQLRKSRQMLAYADTMQTYLTTDEAGRAYVQQVADEHFAGKMEEFTQYYVLARELSTFQKKWNKDKQYKSYEKAAKKLEKEKKKEEYTCWLQQQFVESMMGATSMLEILFDGDTREKAFLWEAMEKELDRAAKEEVIETVAIIALTRGYGSLVKAADTAGDVAKTAK